MSATTLGLFTHGCLEVREVSVTTIPLTNSFVPGFYDIEQHWVGDSIPYFERIRLPELRNPKRVEIMNAVYVRAI